MRQCSRSGSSDPVVSRCPMTDSPPQADRDSEVFAGGGGLVWHPAIRALGWIKDWMFWSLLAAVLWECIALGSHPVSPAIPIDSVIVHTLAICAAVACLAIP